jgi:hypothetical protein
MADSHLFQIYAAIFCDLLWFSRNQALHKGAIPEVAKLAEKIKRVSYEHFSAWSSKMQPIKEIWSSLLKVSTKSILMQLLEKVSQLRQQFVETPMERSSRLSLKLDPPAVLFMGRPWQLS